MASRQAYFPSPGKRLKEQRKYFIPHQIVSEKKSYFNALISIGDVKIQNLSL
jgi:hypothetical protein